MPPTLRYLMLVSGLATMLGCQDGTGPARASVDLRTDLLDVTLPPQPPQSPPTAISIFVKNQGSAPITVRMCNNGGFPGADLTLQVRDSSGAFVTYVTRSWITCNDPADGFDLRIRPDQEKSIARLLGAPEAGEFRYQLVYIDSNGKTGVVTSNAFIAHQAP